MPGGNKKGPLGQGPMTGRAQGFCTGNNAPGGESTMPRLGLRRGKSSRGRGNRSGRRGGFGFGNRKNFGNRKI